MPIDPSINLGYRPVQAPQPVNQFEAMVNAAKLKEYQSAQESKNALAAAYKGATNPETGEVDINRLRSSLAAGGLGAEIPGLEKTYYEGMGAKTSALKAQAEFQLSRLRQARETIASFTTPEDAKVALDNSLANGEIDPNAYKSLVTRIPTDPAQMPAFQQALLRENLTADQRLEQHLATIDSGGRTQTFAMPKFAGGGGPQKILDITKTLTPGDIQQARDAAASRTVTMRGQNMTDARAREKIALDAAKKGANAGGGAEGVTTQVENLRSYYDRLKDLGGITRAGGKTGANIAASLRSSGAGQLVGKALGTEDQSIRNSIVQSRPLLLQAIKQATGMTAKQMDSNVELKLYLNAATDPTLDYEANMRALDQLDKLYGLGIGSSAPTSSAGVKRKPLGSFAR